MKAITLMRYIRKAREDKTFVKARYTGDDFDLRVNERNRSYASHEC